MGRVINKAGPTKNGFRAKPAVSKLGRDLRRISDKIAASGEKPLTRRELEREIAVAGRETSEHLMIRTFFDSGVLIAAARSVGPDRARALELLGEPDRVPLTSPLVQLEVVPKATFFRKRLEQSFYDKYFANEVWFREVDRIEVAAQTEAIRAGLGAMDALHLAAAHLSNADEFITTEKPTKAIHRSSLVKVIYLFG